MHSTDLKQEIHTQLVQLSSDAGLGYLAITSKPELAVRDRIAANFHSKFPQWITAREFTINCGTTEKRTKKVDMSLLDQQLNPVAHIEFKSMISPDPIVVPQHRLMQDLASDLQRISQICHTPAVGVMLMVHIQDPRAFEGKIDGRIVKYLIDYSRQQKKGGKLADAIGHTEKFFTSNSFKVTSVVSPLGDVWGSPIELVSFVIEA